MTVDPVYRLTDRRRGTVMFGLTVPQLTLVTIGVVTAVLVPARHHSAVGVLAGLLAAAGCAALAFVPIDGQPAWQAVLLILAFLARGGRGSRWLAPLPLLTGAGVSPIDSESSGLGRRQGGLPRCLTGLRLLAVPRPAWAGADRTLASIGLVADRRTGQLTVVLDVRGSGFTLLDGPERGRRLTGWAQVLSQFGRAASPVVRIGWSLASAPAPLTDHLDWLDGRSGTGGPQGNVESDYRLLVADAAAQTWRHELRVWLTVDPGRAARSGAEPAAAALAAARALTDRCTSAGLVCSPPLSPVEIALAVRVQADPTAVRPLVPDGLAVRAGLATTMSGDLAGGQVPHEVHAAPLAVEAHWDAVRLDGAWHRVFWVAQWPTLELPAGWWEPLLLDPAVIRTLAVVMEPVPARASRRRINSDSVSLQGQVHLRERHAFRVPVGLQHAQADVDQREVELQAGFPEYGYLALACVTATDRPGLDQASQALLDAAARCGIVELRPLHGRHDAAWACTLPVGRAPDRELLSGPR